MRKIFPNKLKPGNTIAVISPSRSFAIIADESKKIANNRFRELDLKLSFGKHLNEINYFASSSIKSRVEDLHNAFSDKNVKAIITVIGGFNSNQLLKYIDWNLIKENPKIFCGFSDITALNNAIFQKTGLVTYSGPHYSSFGQKLYFDYTLDYFKRCFFSENLININPSEFWSDDSWYKNQENRSLVKNNGWLIINKGAVAGTILGANLCTFNLLQGTEYFPDISDSVLFVEDDSDSKPYTFDRDLQSLIHQPDFSKVKALVIGRFQKESEMTDKILIEIIKTKKELDKIPVIANVDFGHTDPKITFPIGGTCEISTSNDEAKIIITKH